MTRPKVISRLTKKSRAGQFAQLNICCHYSPSALGALGALGAFGALCAPWFLFVLYKLSLSLLVPSYPE